MAKKIALWGYGCHGKDVEALFRAHSDWPEITAVFDLRFDEINRGAPKRVVLNPARVEEYCRQGLFDAVMITVCDQTLKDSIAALLASLNVPTFECEEELSNRFLFRPPEYFPQGRVDFSWQERDGYGFHALRDMRMAFSRLNGFELLFDGDGRILSSVWKEWNFQVLPSLKMIVPPESQDSVFLPGEWCFLAKPWAANYWHFVNENLDQALLLEKSGYTGRYILPKERFVEEFTALLGVAPERIVWLESFDRSAVYQFETLVCTELLNDNRQKSAPVALEMAEYFLNRLEPCDRVFPRRIFVERIGVRKLLLDEEIKTLLDRYGFETIVPENLSVADQIRYFNRADVVLSPHGANSTNSLFMRPGSVFIETFPKNYVNPCCTETLALSGVHYLPVFEPYGYEGYLPDIHRDYRVNPRFLEMALRTATALTERSRG